MILRLTSAAALLLCLGSAARAEELSPEQVAKVRTEEQQALDKVNAAHGNRRPSEMDPEERRQVIQEQRQASQEVLEHNGVSAKDYARSSASLHGEDRERMEATSRALKAKQEADPKASASKETRAAEPTIEYGLPKDEVGGAAQGGGTGGPRRSSKIRKSSAKASSKKHRREY